jgi:glycosyltransferase involved in cell wall biosynthesis
MTIAIVANTTWNIYNFRLNILAILTKYRYNVMVIAPKDEYEVYQKAFPTVKHIPLKQLARKSINPFQDLRLCYELFQIYQREKPDLILHYTIKANIYGGIAATLLKIKYLCVVTGLGYSFIHNGVVYAISKQLYRIAFHQAAGVIFENKDDKTLFQQLKIIAPSKSYTVKGCGIDLNHFHFMPKTQLSTDFIFCFVGRFLWDKGILEFVEAAKIIRRAHPHTQFWLVGAPDDENPASVPTHQIQQWEDTQIIINQGFAKDVRSFMRNSDCIVLPSYREGMPTVLAEAGAMHKPIITTDVAGCREMVEQAVNGYLVPAKSAKALANAMLKMLHLSVGERAAMGKNARYKIETASDNQSIAHFFLKMVQDIVESKKIEMDKELIFNYFNKSLLLESGITIE